ncbi:hypothetical protein E4U41_004762, partial [Claviceps citrina]
MTASKVKTWYQTGGTVSTAAAAAAAAAAAHVKSATPPQRTGRGQDDHRAGMDKSLSHSHRWHGQSQALNETRQLLVTMADARPSSSSSSPPPPQQQQQQSPPSAPVVDFSGNFGSSARSWRRRVLTAQSDPNVNYTVVAAGTGISSISWVASRDASFAGPEQATIDTLAGGAGGVDDGRSVNRWLSRGHDAVTGRHFITIQVQSWLQKMAEPPDDARGLGGGGVRMAGEGFEDDRGSGSGSDSHGSYVPRPGDYMKLRIGWTRQDEGPLLRTGASTSGLFTVADSVDSPSVRNKWSEEFVRNFDKAQDRGAEEAAAGTEAGTATGTGLGPLSS